MSYRIHLSITSTTGEPRLRQLYPQSGNQISQFITVVGSTVTNSGPDGVGVVATDPITVSGISIASRRKTGH